MHFLQLFFKDNTGLRLFNGRVNINLAYVVVQRTIQPTLDCTEQVISVRNSKSLLQHDPGKGIKLCLPNSHTTKTKFSYNKKFCMSGESSY